MEVWVDSKAGPDVFGEENRLDRWMDYFPVCAGAFK
jgi:hypothetical protein